MPDYCPDLPTLLHRPVRTEQRATNARHVHVPAYLQKHHEELVSRPPVPFVGYPS
jgi:hypothetical protein